MQSYFIAKSFILIELNFRAHGRYECLGSPWCSQRSSERTQWTQFYYTICIQTLSLPPAIFHHRDIIGAAETVSWITAVALVKVSFFMCIVCLLGFTTILKNPFFFFGEGEREEKKIFFNMYMRLLWCTPSSFMCKKTFPHIIANSFCSLELIFDLN